MMDWWDNLKSEDRKVFADVIIMVGIVLGDLTIAAAFPTLERLVLSMIGFFWVAFWLLKISRETKTYRDFTR